MAIYHLTAKTISRAKGKSAVASAAYRRAAMLYDEKAEKTWNYTNKPDVIYSQILVPENATDWVKALAEMQHENPNDAAEQLWNKVEFREKRKDAQFAREIEFAIPIELDEEQAKALVNEFIKDQFVSHGMIADVNIHWDEGNPHVHVMLTMRELTEDGFGLKQRDWNSKAILQTWREKWAEYANFHLYMHQKDVRIDHRSYQDQGIDLVPTIHQGKAVTDMTARGIETAIMQEANAIRRENLERIVANPNVILDKVTSQTSTFTQAQLGQELGRYINDRGRFTLEQKSHHATQVLNEINQDEAHIEVLTPENVAEILASIEHHDSVFSERDIAKAVTPFTDNAEQFAQAILKVKASPEMIYLGPGDDGRDRFTTQRMFNLENRIQQLVDEERDRKHVKLSPARVDTLLQHYEQRLGKQLTDEQKNAIKHILQPTAICCLVGRAGTGKSFSIGAAKAIWESEGLPVLGVALSGIAADGLVKDAGIDSRTIESFRLALEKAQLTLTSQHVVVMDEAGMTDSTSMLAVLNAIQKAKAKLVLGGDNAQIQPVGPGATFRALLERLGFAEIQTVYRQREEWQREATVAFSAGRITDGLMAYEAHQCIHLENSQPEALARIKSDWFNASATATLDNLLVITHRNEDVQKLNQVLREERVAREQIAEGYTIRTSQGTVKIAQGDRLLFLKNDRKLGVSNGRFATVTNVNFTETGNVINFTVVLDGTEKEVTINPKTYQGFTHGYAATVHKVQGMTVDHAFVYAGGTGWDRHLTYVAMSRHRESCTLYADKESFSNHALLYKRLGRFGIKDSLLDFPLSFAERRGLDTSVLQSLLPKHLGQRLHTFKEKLKDRVEQWINPESYAARQHEKAEQQLAHCAQAKQREDARLVAHYVDTHRAVGMRWQALQAKLQKMGLAEMAYDTPTFGLIAGTQEYQALQQALRKRNQVAAAIMKDSTRYQIAINIYGLELNNLQKQAERFSYYQQVNAYQTYHQAGRAVLRDKLAATFMRHIKAYYPELKAAGIDSNTIRKQAIAHLKRQCFKPLTSEARQTQRQVFQTVEAYLSINQQIGKTYHALHDVAKRDDMVRLNTLTHERDRLAALIVKDRQHYDKALGFYQIGLATPLFDEKPTEAQIKRAENRWDKLQQQAVRHDMRTRVGDYHKALTLNDTLSRLRLAYEIVQDTKHHHGAIVNLGENTQELWRTIRKDAKQFERHQHYSQLDLVDRIGFRTVEKYIEAKRAHAAAWRELFESKATAQLSEDTLYQTLAGFAESYTQLRNKLAAEISASPSLHQAGLDYFSLQVEDLQPQAYAYQCNLVVDSYTHSQDKLTRAELAQQMISDTHAYHPFVKSQGLAWKILYKEACIAERKTLFSTLTPEERSLYRLASRYRTANQAVGRHYCHLKTQKTPVQSELLSKLSAKRDYLAWRLVTTSEASDENWLASIADNNRLKLDKLLQQANVHQERLDKLETWQAALQEVAQTATLEKIDKGLTHIAYAEQLAKIYRLEKNNAAYQYALLPSQLPLKKQLESLGFLKQQLKQMAAVQGIASTVDKAVSKRLHDTLNKTPTRYQKIDIAALRNDLNAQAEEVARHYLGSPKHRQGFTWRYGTNQGSLVVTVKGQRQGLWRDFQTQEGGDMLRLIQHSLGTRDFKVVLDEATRFLGGASSYTLNESRPVSIKPPVVEDNARIRIAQSIYQDTQPITGTLAERYLREHRKIEGPINEETFRYHTNLKNWKNGRTYPALVIAAKDNQQSICGVQAIFLDETTAKKADIGHIAKLSRGSTREGALVHQGNSQGKIALAEGPETALSVAAAHPDWNVYVTFGVSNFTKVALKTGSSSVVICADNDGPYSGTAKSVDKSAKALSEKGVDVWVALPEKPEAQAKWDFNDTLQHQGLAHVKQDLDNATLHTQGITPSQRIEAIEHAKSILETRHKDSPLHQLSLEALLIQYVDMELKQTELMTAKLEALSSSPEQRKVISEQIQQHAKELEHFTSHAIAHPDVKKELEHLKGIKTPSLASQGGFKAIRDRMTKQALTSQDRQVLITQLRIKALSRQHAQTQERDRGGRTR